MSDNQVKIKKQTIDPTLTLEDVKKQLIDKGKKRRSFKSRRNR